MSQKKQVAYEDINNFIIAINCIEEIEKYLQEFQDSIVNRVESQTRQPSLYFSAIMSDHQLSYNIMKLLIEHGANAKFKDNYQQTILFYVCREGKEKCLELLMEQGLDLDEEDIYGQTPAYYAAKENRISIMRRLIDHKVDLNHADKIASQTPLFYAAKEGHLDMCRLLVESGCDISHQDLQHKVASHYAKKAGKNEVLEYLSSEYLTLKEQKRVPPDNHTESNLEEKASKKKKKEALPAPPQQKTLFKLYRADSLGHSSELTAADFEEFLATYPHLESMFRAPDEIDLSNIEHIKAEDSWVKAAGKVLTLCYKSKGSYFFQEPVDPVKFAIEDYFDIIKHPMDFGTIRRKLNFNVYNHIGEFAADMKLVFDNCIRYNGDEHQVSGYAVQIRNLFEENLKIMGYSV